MSTAYVVVTVLWAAWAGLLGRLRLLPRQVVRAAPVRLRRTPLVVAVARHGQGRRRRGPAGGPVYAGDRCYGRDRPRGVFLRSRCHGAAGPRVHAFCGAAALVESQIRPASSQTSDGSKWSRSYVHRGFGQAVGSARSRPQAVSRASSAAEYAGTQLRRHPPGPVSAASIFPALPRVDFPGSAAELRCIRRTMRRPPPRARSLRCRVSSGQAIGLGAAEMDT